MGLSGSKTNQKLTILEIVTTNHLDHRAESTIGNLKFMEEEEQPLKLLKPTCECNYQARSDSDNSNCVEEKLPLHPHSVALFHLKRWQVADAS